MVLGIFMFILPLTVMTQERPVGMEEAIGIALQNNKSLLASEGKVQKQRDLLGSAYDINKTHVYYNFDENNIAENGVPIKVWGISQSLQFPTIYGAQRKLQKSQIAVTEQEFSISKQMLTKEVSKAYIMVLYCTKY
ncbi:MAG: hypothetical protein U5K51_08730 [Flavobacteriaceae bacterium]|nr:hypothetical protein [Flavobacteriaceae bacterium]